jgi:hypothetical protein
MESAPSGDELVAGPEKQVIGVPEDDLGASIAKVPMQRGLDSALRADRHERRRLHDAMRGVELPAAGRAIRAMKRETEGAAHCSVVSGFSRTYY